MTSKFYGKLIALFAAHRCEEVEANDWSLLKQALGQDIANIAATTTDYSNDFSCIKECRKEIDGIVRDFPQTADQVSPCLRALNLDREAKKNERFSTFLALLKASLYANSWTQRDREIFDTKFKAIFEWKTYFLSYTNRDAQATNNTFERVIKHWVPKVRKDSDDWAKKNLLARVIVKLLQQSNQIGFFDVDAIRSGDDIGARIRVYCRRSWAFVQMVEYQSFATPEGGKPNWCFEEYDEFERGRAQLDQVLGSKHDGRFHFVIAVDDEGGPIDVVDPLIPPGPDNKYDPWITTAKKLKAMTLTTRNANQVRSIVRDVAFQADTLRAQAVAEMLQ